MTRCQLQAVASSKIELTEDKMLIYEKGTQTLSIQDRIDGRRNAHL